MRSTLLPGALVLAALVLGAGTATAAESAVAPTATGTFESVAVLGGLLTERAGGVTILPRTADPAASGQVWRVTNPGVGPHAVQTLGGRCLASTIGINPLGDEDVLIEACDGGPKQQWNLRKDSRGTALRNVANDHVVTVTDSGAVIARIDKGQAGQRFTALLHVD